MCRQQSQSLTSSVELLAKNCCQSETLAKTAKHGTSTQSFHGSSVPEIGNWLLVHLPANCQALSHMLVITLLTAHQCLPVQWHPVEGEISLTDRTPGSLAGKLYNEIGELSFCTPLSNTSSRNSCLTYRDIPGACLSWVPF